MSIPVTCECGKRLAAKPEMAGKRVKCPACGSPIEIPSGGKARPKNSVRCSFCHEYVPRSQYDAHVQEHLALREDGQQNEYATLPPEERDDADFETAPRWYRHEKCENVTGMPEEIIQTYLTDPWFYLADKTFCTGCAKHVPLKECFWMETDEDLQTYTDRLRAAKPEKRPGVVKRALVWLLSRLG